MSTLVLKDCTIWANEFDLTADTNGVEGDWEADEVDATNFASAGNQELKAGIAKSSVALQTFYDSAAGGVESVLTSLKGTTGNIISVTPDGAAHSRAIFARGLGGSLKMPFKLGDMARLEGGFKTSSAEGLVEGYVLLPKSTITATSTGTIYNDGAVSSTQKVYGALHVFAASGTTPSLTVKVQSAALVGFGSPTDRLTFAAKTAVGSEFLSASGAITDAFWRVSYTISGTTPSFTFAVVYGIQ